MEVMYVRESFRKNKKNKKKFLISIFQIQVQNAMQLAYLKLGKGTLQMEMQ